MIGTAVSLLFAFMAIGLPIAVILAVLALILAGLYTPIPIDRALGELVWTQSNSFLLLTVPLYVMLGEILLRSGLADRMYTAAARWVGWLPGGMLHANIGASAVFAATCGSSSATAATIGTVALPQGRRYGYNEKLFLGSLASGGTLGILIPPSVSLVLFGALTNTSIPQLYMAAIVPGLLLMGLFMLVLMGICLLRPGMDGDKVHSTWGERLRALADLLPPAIIFVLVIGSIYTGWATATESAAIGVLAALALAAMRTRIDMAFLSEVFVNTMRTTSMIMLIVIAAFFLNFVITAVGLTSRINSAITTLDLGPLGLMVMVVIFYIVLGCLMETISMMIATIPIIFPVVVAAGFDPVWFGVVLVILIELALITPPVGMNLFVIQGIRPRGAINDVIVGAVPFVAAIMVLIALLVAFPEIALWLPETALDRG